MKNNSQYWTSDRIFKRIDSLLEMRKMSFCQLSIESEYTSYSSIYKARRTKALPTFQTICSICDALGIYLWEFFYVSEARSRDAKSAVCDLKKILTAAWQPLTRLSELLKQI